MKKTQAQTVKKCHPQSQIINTNTNTTNNQQPTTPPTTPTPTTICLGFAEKMLGKNDAHTIPNGGVMVICHGRIHKNITFFLEKIQVFVWVNTIIHGSNVGYVHIQLHKEIGQFQSSPTSKIRILSGRACIVSPGGSFEDPSASSTSLPESWESALPKASASSSSWEF